MSKNNDTSSISEVDQRGWKGNSTALERNVNSDSLADQEANAISETLSNVEDEEIEDFIKKYGDIKVSFITPPTPNPWFTRPHALNYFHNGRLFRTKNERTSGSLELFLDLVYVGVVANLASSAIEEHDWHSLWKYILVFIPTWQIWVDIKEFMNYYFNGDLLQNVFVLWEIVLLVIYNNNCEFVDEIENKIALRSCVVTYTLARWSFAGILGFYSLYITEHRLQMWIFATAIAVTSAIWYLILLIDVNWGRALFAALMFTLEQTMFTLSVHPWFKRKLKLEYSTALNIEHEDERFHAFYVIAIGEFLYSICAGSPLKEGWNEKLTKGIALIIIAFLLLGFYSRKDGSRKATHALRRSATTAILYIYSHLPLIASLLVMGDAGADLTKLEVSHLEHEEFGILIYFHTGLLIAMISLTAIALSDEARDGPGDHIMNRYFRIGLRFPIVGLIFGLTWLYEHISLVRILWIDCCLLLILYMYEFVVIYPPWDKCSEVVPSVA